MTRAFVLSIGNELLSGLTVDTNAAWITGRLAQVGIQTVGILTVPDEIDDTVESLHLAEAKADIIITTGGLGPTDDDLTRQAMARFLDVELQIRPELLETMAAFFRRRNYPMVDKNRIQACLPVGTEAIPNATGTAPGIFVRKGHALVFCLPGVPSEMKSMFDDFIVPRLAESTLAQVVISRRLKCFGAGESMIAEKLGDRMLRGRNPLINCTVSESVITLHIVATAADRNTAEAMIQQDQRDLCEILGDWIYGTGDQTLAEVVGVHLAQTGKTLAVAESCTGGLIAKLLTDVPGSSRYFAYGWVTYGNQAKQTELGIEPALLEVHGAVSEPVAQAMAEGALRVSGADIAVAVTGIAGPDGGTEQKPVGLVYISIATPGMTTVRKFLFPHPRAMMRTRTALTALNLIRLQIGH